MGIQDRDYYRNEGPSIFDSLVPSGLVCRWLIAINIGIYFGQMVALSSTQFDEDARQVSSGWLTDWFILDTQKVLTGQVWRLLTYAFLHSPDFVSFHLIFNMLFLWWFGSDVEQLYGRREFLAIYLISALAGGCCYEVWSLAMEQPGRCLGASGAITTMLILCALHYPRRIVYVYLLPMPIWMFAIFNVVQDSMGLFGMIRSNVAFVVHLGGAVFAVAYYKRQWSITGAMRDLMWWRRPTRARSRLKLFEPSNEAKEPVAVTAIQAAPGNVDEHLEAKLDAVLEKLQTKGKESLTEQEQEILRQASAMYKKRRT